MLSGLINRLRVALCTLGLTTSTSKNPSLVTLSDSIKDENIQLGVLVRDENYWNSTNTTAPSRGFTLTREYRKHLLRELKQAKEIRRHICIAQEQYAMCSDHFGFQLTKTVEFLDTYYKHINDTYNAIHSILHCQPNQISRADLAAALQGINETLKKQACEELGQFPMYPDRRITGT